MLDRVIPQCSSLVAALDAVVAGRQSQELIKRTGDLLTSFRHAQSALSSSRTITLPRASDQLWMITDGAAKPPDIVATLYVTRNNKLLLFSVQSSVAVRSPGSPVRWKPYPLLQLPNTSVPTLFSLTLQPAS